MESCRYFRAIDWLGKSHKVWASDKQEAMGSLFLDHVYPDDVVSVEVWVEANEARERFRVRRKLIFKIQKIVIG